MKNFFSKINLASYSGIGTILVVFGISLFWLYNSNQYYLKDVNLLYFSFAIYLASFIRVTQKDRKTAATEIAVLLSLQLASAFVLMLNFPIEFLSILTIIWISLIPYYLSLRLSVITLLIVVTLWFSLYAYAWQQQTIFSALLYGTFHFFAILMTYNLKQA